MKKYTATVTGIVQGTNGGTVQFQVKDENDPKKPSPLVIGIQFTDAREAAKYEHLKVYEISINPKK